MLCQPKESAQVTLPLNTNICAICHPLAIISTGQRCSPCGMELRKSSGVRSCVNRKSTHDFPIPLKSQYKVSLCLLSFDHDFNASFLFDFCTHHRAILHGLGAVHSWPRQTDRQVVAHNNSGNAMQAFHTKISDCNKRYSHHCLTHLNEIFHNGENSR